MHATNRRPAGFTLIELLVVVALLAVLAALSTGAYFRIRAGQQVKATEDTVSKLESGFQSLWKAELDDARDAFKGTKSGFSAQVDAVKTLAANDQDRALALWTYVWMKRAFPQNFTQAQNGITLQSTPTLVTLPPSPMFVSPAFTPVATPGNTGDEAAVILYRIMTQKGSRGQTFNEEAIGALSALLPRDNTAGQRVFTDSFGNPITFIRMSSGNGELNAPPFIKNANSTNNDPFDPAGRLTGLTSGVAFTATGRTSFGGQNWLPTIVSRTNSPDWGTLAAAPSDLTLIPDGFTCGYKLRRQGARGDQ
ncbi:prepilin-type N-terminal cleavage/methylation domain-containing protein [Limnoglobus roseus]|uniref:Prepilin-type N-terminal cleavage/methylation domain-containing protein n=1 Tax=Limnoglobus roseus TaxID=2598579 RepID=A0A5C1A8A3_9BACT|nr:prepilin-type N-terminal cleavage/methylation domain-containing protein [Limnoglobus roseus]QEL15441.1 hypothetical protein PX52LOC_02360 [Limnoglobus roseus]